METRERICFKEEQPFRYSWIFLLILLGITVLFSWGMFQQLVLKQPWGDKPSSDGFLVGISLVMISFFAILYFVFRSSLLITEIKSDGVHLRYPPGRKKDKIYHIDDIVSFEKSRTGPGSKGYGAKKNLLRKRIAYTVSLSPKAPAVTMEMKSGYKVIIETRKQELFVDCLRKMKNIRI